MSVHAEQHNQSLRNLAVLVIVATVVYQAVLCAVHTHVMPMSRALVGVAELMIMLASLPLIFRRMLPHVVVFAALTGAMLCLLVLLRGSVDVKAFRDLLIPVWFYWLGRNVGDPRLADWMLKAVIALLLAFGVFELVAVDRFTDIFDIFSYYVAIGNLQPITDYVRESRLQLSGIRPEDIGRTLLPSLLGQHRVSSLYLEPVSLGNFATVVAAWGLARGRDELGQMLFYLTAAIVLIVLADSRFALISVALLVALRILVHGRANYMVVLMPFAIIALLVYLGLFTQGVYGDNYLGRLVISGRSLVGFDAPTLLGYGTDGWYADEGYAYVLYTFGVVLAIALWVTLWLIPMPDERGNRFRCYVAVYIALILAISGTSLFALKSAGVLWFLFGCMQRDPAPGLATAGAEPQPVHPAPEGPPRGRRRRQSSGGRRERIEPVLGLGGEEAGA
ncbi:MAG: hypothetical protein JJU06_09370 [Ectothiorhodospiraceae bacterium]|nr:hypothetical protein [Ectothiorhodospiraceae bacterium]